MNEGRVFSRRQGVAGLMRIAITFGWLLASMATAASAQWLTQDKPDYAPGETAVLTGSDFAPGESVVLQVLHASGHSDSLGADHEPWTVFADVDGGFVTTWHVCEDDCIGQSLVATAEGQSSALYAETAFMDSGPSSNTPRPELPVTDGTVNAIVESGNTVYVGGTFSSIAMSTGGAASINAGSALPDLGFPKVNGTVYALASDGSGGWYLGGTFTTVGGLPRNRLAHIDASNNVTAWDPNANNEVRALVVSGGLVYAGGLFNGAGSIGGAARNRIAALDATTGLATAWDPDANGSVLDLELSGSTVYAGGQFTTVGGQTRNRIAALDATTGLATAWNPNASSAVFALAVSGSNIYVGGAYTSIGGQTRNRIAAIAASTGLATTWNPNASSSVFALTVSGSTIYAGGDFTTIGGSSRNFIAGLNASTGLATAWNPNADHNIFTLVVNGSTVYAGGRFTAIGGQARNRIAAIDAATGLSTGWNPNANNFVRTLAIGGGTIYVGGEFNTIGQQPRNRLAAFDATTGAIRAWNPNANGTIETLLTTLGRVYAGGSFTSVGGQTRNRIAAIDPTTGAVQAWNPNSNGTVRALAMSGSTVYAGGGFTSIGGQTRSNLAALDATTGLATGWNPLGSGTGVRALAITGNTVYVGGDFTDIGGFFRNRIAALDATTGSILAWNPNANNSVSAIAVSGSTIYVGGFFTSIGGQARNQIAALDATTGLASSWSPNANSSVRTIVASGGVIYVGGDFTSISGQIRNRIAALDATTGAADAWNPNASGTVAALATGGTTLYAGGSFSIIGGELRQTIAGFAISTCTAPIIESSPASVVVCAGSAVTFSVLATGTGPLSYQWRKGGADIVGATGSTYTISSPTVGEADSYDAVVTNSCGSVTSAPATLTVSTPPTILSEPAAASVCSGAPMTFFVTASGTEPLSYQWRQGGVAIGGATGSSYSIAAVMPGSAGSYDVLITNSCGTVTSTPVTLVVETPPVIATGPVAATACLGSPVTFFVSASGTEPLAYQWRKGGVAIGGATDNSYTITSVTSGSAGSYDVLVSNGCGSVTSTSAVLVVNTLPVITYCPPDVTVQCGGSTSASSTGIAEATGTGVTMSAIDAFVAGCGNTGVITRTWAATGACGTTTCVQTISIVDVTAPVIAALPDPSTILCPSVPVFAQATATDGCNSFSLTHVDVTTPGTCGGAYSVTRTWTATDACGNSSTASQIIHVVDTTAPGVTISSPASGSVYPIGTPVNFTGGFADGCGNPHTATWTFDTLQQSGTVTEGNPGTVTGTRTFSAAGVYMISLTVADNCGNTGMTNQIDGANAMVVIYDPNAGFVTGGGWIDSPAGAFVADASLMGRANFGFVSKYAKGAKTPSGETEFQYRVGNLNFHSTIYDWLVVSGAKAQYKGVGTIDGAGSYGFILTAVDGQLTGGGGTDKFRIKITDIAGGTIVYDNLLNAPDTTDPTMVLGQGSIVIHTGSKSSSATASKAQGSDQGGENPTTTIPVAYDLAQNYPNPFGRSTHIAFGLPEPSSVRIVVYDIAGHRVRTLADGEWAPGRHVAILTRSGQDGTPLAAGVYFVRMNAQSLTGNRSFVALKKVVVLE